MTQTLKKLTLIAMAAFALVAIAFAPSASASDQGTTIRGMVVQPDSGSPAKYIVWNNQAEAEILSVNKTTGAVTFAGAQVFNGTLTLGDGGDTVAVNSSAWDITTAGAVTGFTSVGMTGALSGGTTIGCSGNVTSSAGYFQTGAAMPATIAGDSAAFGNRGFMVEGTNDAIEFTFTVTDPAVADNTILIAADGLMTLSDGLTATTGALTATAGNVAAGAIATVDPGVVNVATFGNNGFTVEGSALDANDYTFSVANPTAINSTAINATGQLTNSAGLVATTGNITATNGSVFALDADGYNAGVGEMVSGVPTMRLDVIAGTAATEWAIVDTCEADNWVESGIVLPVTTLDAVNYRIGAGSMQTVFGATDVGSSIVTSVAFGAVNASADEYILVWAMASKTILANSMTLTLTDPTHVTPVAIPAITVANQWQLLRIDISAVPDIDKDAFTNLVITSNHLTDLDGATVHFDQFIKVDAAQSTATGFDIINQPGGMRSAFGFVEDAGNGTFTALVETTNFVVDPLNNVVYWASDTSTMNVIAMYASAN